MDQINFTQVSPASEHEYQMHFLQHTKQKNMTRRIIISIFVFGIICSMASCLWDTDGDLTIIKGKVINRVTGNSMQGMSVELSKCRRTTFGLGCDSFKTVYTNSKGEYALSFRPERHCYYQIGMGQNANCQAIGTNSNGLLIKKRITNVVDFYR